MAEGIRFKTGYVGPAFDFAQAGRDISAQIVADAERRRELERRNRLERDQQYGFTKAMQESVDGKLNSMFRQGAQLLLQDLQEKSSTALVSGDAADIAAYNAAKSEYMSYTNIASAKSAQNNTTRANIIAGNIKGMAGTQEEALASFMSYDKADVSFDENGRLIVFDRDSGEPKYWAESYIADINDLFIPPMMWEGTNYMPENVGKDLYDNLLSASADSLQVRQDGFAVGQINSRDAYALINEDLQRRLELRGPEMLEAMQAFGYKSLNVPGKTELSESDIAKARTMYSEEALFGTVMQDGRNAAKGKINSNGEWQFDVSDEELEAEGYDSLVRNRRAVKEYMEQSAQRAYNLIPVQNQQAQIEALKRDRVEAAAEAAADAADAAADEVQYAPIQPFKQPYRVLVERENPDTKTPERGYVEEPALKVKASVENKYRFDMPGTLVADVVESSGGVVMDKEKLTGAVPVVVNNLIFSQSNGSLIGFDLSTGPGMVEGILLDIDGQPLKNVTVTSPSEAYDEVFAAILGTPSPSKGKRSGDQLLKDAQAEVMYSLNIEPPSDESIERQNNYFQAMQSLTIQSGRDLMESVALAVEELPIRERIQMESLIFEKVSRGNYPTVVDGEIVFPD